MECSNCGEKIKAAGLFGKVAMKCRECGYYYCKECCNASSLTKTGECPRCGGKTVKA